MFTTEQPNPRTAQLDTLPTLAMLRLINDEDQQVALVVAAALPAIAQAVDVIAERLSSGGRLLYVGAGTSGRLGVLDASECVPTYGVPATLVQGLVAGGLDALVNSLEGAEDDAEAGRDDLVALHLSAADAVVGIAASGRTPYVLGALRYANSLGAATVGISNNNPAPLLEEAQIKIPLLTGPEVITGSTRMKAGTAQKMTLNMLSTAVMVKLGKVYGNLMVDVQAGNDKLRARALRFVMQITGIHAEAANQLLQACQWEVKTAVVMHRRGVNAEAARQLLTEAGGRLRTIIG